MAPEKLAWKKAERVNENKPEFAKPLGEAFRGHKGAANLI